MAKDIFLSDFTDPDFQAAFRLYFEELGIRVQNWVGLWQEMNCDPNAQNRAYVRLDEEVSILGFIQFCEMTMQSWFFEERVGFVREFWVRGGARGQGHGRALLQLAEAYFRQQGIHKVILTTDTAAAFYEKHGYELQPGVTARNKDAVYAKRI